MFSVWLRKYHFVQFKERIWANGNGPVCLFIITVYICQFLVPVQSLYPPLCPTFLPTIYGLIIPSNVPNATLISICNVSQHIFYSLFLTQ